MNRVIALLHVVGGKDIGHTSKLMEQPVFESEKRCRSYNGGLWEDAANNLLTTTLGEEN